MNLGLLPLMQITLALGIGANTAIFSSEPHAMAAD